MEANTTLLRLFLRMPKSPLLVTASSCLQNSIRGQGNQNGKVKPEVLVPEIADGIYLKFQRNPNIVLKRTAC